jgi:uncharacterized protein YbjQ (UPF0145 family)/rubrerythrin
MLPTSVQVTTTSGIEEWSIQSYLGIVATHVVAGTGIGSDFLASFSDFFGGRSGAYQNQLASLYDEAIGQLGRKALTLGGNWLVGLRVDIDEISGKGMQMFMVTALGTAVRAVQSSEQASALSVAQNGHVSASDVQVMQRRLQIQVAIEKEKLTLDDPTWEFIVQHRIEEAAPGVLDWLVEKAGDYSWQHMQAAPKQRAIAYFRSLPYEAAARVLYRALGDNPKIVAMAAGIIKDLSLRSLERDLEVINSQSQAARRAVLQIIEAHQPFYRANDVELLHRLASTVQDAFPTRAEVVQAKGLLGGSKERWICRECGERGNDPESERCSKCGRDQQGFRYEEIGPSKALSILAERYRALVEVLKDAQP